MRNYATDSDNKVLLFIAKPWNLESIKWMINKSIKNVYNQFIKAIAQNPQIIRGRLKEADE